eukprot:scaffold12461_cov67-Phaeocystis_antarctica.AAC.4
MERAMTMLGLRTSDRSLRPGFLYWSASTLPVCAAELLEVVLPHLCCHVGACTCDLRASCDLRVRRATCVPPAASHLRASEPCHLRTCHEDRSESPEVPTQFRVSVL